MTVAFQFQWTSASYKNIIKKKHNLQSHRKRTDVKKKGYNSYNKSLGETYKPL